MSRTGIRAGRALWAAALLAALPVAAHSPTVDADISDWCFGAPSNGPPNDLRLENTGDVLVCGRCSSATAACRMSSDCPAGESCIELGSRFETVWWDDRTDAAVNDLATVATTQDNGQLYFALQLWDYPDPVSLPFFEIAIDFRPGGIGFWHDPLGALTDAGHCSVDTDRGCTSDADCHFCTVTTEAPPSTRPRSCGSGCNPDIPQDVCDVSQVCEALGTAGPLPGVGSDAVPPTLPDYLVVIDTGRWLIGFEDSIQLMADVGGVWTAIGAFPIIVPPGASTGPGFPPAHIEFSIPWSAFGCTGCPTACVCPDLGPGQEFLINAMIARTLFTFDYSPDGAIEDVQSEAVAGATTTTGDSCPGFGTGTTACELVDGSQDAFVHVAAAPPPPGGVVEQLVLGKASPPMITLSWSASCSAADVDYAVYRGTLGSFFDHAPLAGCSTGGGLDLTVDPGPGDLYFLVVPNDGGVEGSYGLGDGAIERPGGSSACFVQQLTSCP